MQGTSFALKPTDNVKHTEMKRIRSQKPKNVYVLTNPSVAGIFFKILTFQEAELANEAVSNYNVSSYFLHFLLLVLQSLIMHPMS